MRKLTEKLHNDRLITSCLTCEHFEESEELCALFIYERPPARVIAYGCDRWTDVSE